MVGWQLEVSKEQKNDKIIVQGMMPEQGGYIFTIATLNWKIFNDYINNVMLSFI